MQLFATLFTLFIVALLLKFIPSKYFQPRDYRLELVENWAERLGYELIVTERRYFVTTPFVWIASRGIFIYYVELVDEMGRVRKGYIRFRSRWYGKLDSNSLQARWL